VAVGNGQQVVAGRLREPLSDDRPGVQCGAVQPSQVVATPVGTLAVRSPTATAERSYVVSGISQAKSIVRQVLRDRVRLPMTNTPTPEPAPGNRDERIAPVLRTLGRPSMRRVT
jgi:hypothetical protein